jgi:hypothetical protein
MPPPIRASPPPSPSERSSSLDRARRGDTGEGDDEDELCSSPGTSPCSSVHLPHQHTHVRAAVGAGAGGGGGASTGGGRKASVSLQLFKESADDQLDLSPPPASTSNASRTDVKGKARTTPGSPNPASARSSPCATSPRHSVVKVAAASSTPKSSRPSPSSSHTSPDRDRDRQLTDLSLPPSISHPFSSSSLPPLATSAPSSRQLQPQPTNRLVPSAIIDTHATLPSSSSLPSPFLEPPSSTSPSENHQQQHGRYRNHHLPQMNASVSDTVPLRRKSFKIVSSPLTRPLPPFDKPRGRKDRIGGGREVDWVALEGEDEEDGKRLSFSDEVLGISGTSSAGASSASWGTTLFDGEGEADSWVVESADELDDELEKEGASFETEESEGRSYDYELEVGSMDIGSLSPSPSVSRPDYEDPR